jgi:hypothetical protein
MGLLENTFPDAFNHLEEIHLASEAKVLEITAAIKAQVASGDTGRPNEEINRLVKEARQLRARSLREMRRLLRNFGISEKQVRDYEKAVEAKRLPAGGDYWHHQILSSRSTEDLDRMTAVALMRLLPLVDQDWLRAESEKPYRLESQFLDSPLHLMGGVRVNDASIPGPQRFARMLLLAIDHLNKEPDLDFFSAAMFVPEIAILGNKLMSLPTLPDDLVTSTIFELLVGAACVRRGLTIEMVPENRSVAVPDFRITGFGAIPATVECKRRLGFSTYEVEEARRVEVLYAALRTNLREKGFHCSVEASFSVPIREIEVGQFVEDVLTCTKWGQDSATQETLWGSVAVRHLPFFRMVWQTRLYSPTFLEEVFDWRVLQSEWDGILCEVDSPDHILVESFRSPLCLKWRSDSPKALAKKSRGVTSLWGSAIKQIPPGELGFVYIAYPEGNRPAVADARTRNVIQAMEESWHDWFVRIPVTVISRLYPRPVGVGNPDLIESALPGAAKNQEHWLTRVPYVIFTRQFEYEDDEQDADQM